MRTAGRRFVLRVLGASLIVLCAPSISHANVGVPMLAVALPGMIVLLVPIILIEAYFLKRYLSLPFPRAARTAALTNVESTLLGIPITWIALVVIGYGIQFLGYSVVDKLELKVPTLVQILLSLTLGVAWLAPFESDLYWMVPVASLVLLVPFFFASWYIERWRTCRLLKDVDPQLIRAATFRANLASYGLLSAVVITWLFVSVLQHKTT